MLHIVTVVFNPRQYKRRYELYRQFKTRIDNTPNAKLYTVELALGDRPFELNADVSLRTNDEWFVKENLLNLGVAALPEDAEYIACIDADVAFADPDWAQATIDKLQHHPVVQMFSEVVNLTHKHEPFQLWPSFAARYDRGEEYDPSAYNLWHPGFAWAYRREALEAFGGLMDRCLVGSADSHMAAALIGQVEKTVHAGMPQSFWEYIWAWEKNAQKFMKDHDYSLGVVPGLLLHHWHGQMKNRKYAERWDILTKHEFNPGSDLVPGLNGLLHLGKHKAGLRRAVQDYFSARDEDCIYFDPNEDTIHKTP